MSSRDFLRDCENFADGPLANLDTFNLHNIKHCLLPGRPRLRHLGKGGDEAEEHAAEGCLDHDDDEARRDLPDARPHAQQRVPEYGHYVPRPEKHWRWHEITF